MIDELHIIVYAVKSLGLKTIKLAPNVWVYPTNSISRWLYIFDAANLGKKIVYENKFVRGASLITTQDPFECGLAGVMVKNKWRIPLEVQVHTNLFSPNFDGFLNKIRKLIAKKVLSKADSIRVVAGYLKKQIKTMTPAPILVLPVYVDRDKIENNPISFDVHGRFGWHFVILTVARLTTEKNLFLALDILKKVRERYPNTGLVIVGSGPEEDKLRKYTSKLKLDGYVAFEGWQENLTSYYKTSNLFLQTSYFEGNSLAIIEAGLCGLPIVMTNVGIAEELEHGKEAYVYKHNELQEMAEGVTDLIENNNKRSYLSINMRQRLENILLTKEEYLNKMKTNWEETALKIK